MRRILLLSGLPLLFVLARCGGEEFGSSGSGGPKTDSGTGGAGGSSSGGTNTGGSAAGGSATGGSATGGSGGTGVTDAATDVIGPKDASTLDATVGCGIELNTVSHTIATNVVEVSVPHTVAAGKPLLLVTLAIRHDNDLPNTIPYATGITYAGNALTKLKAQTDNYYQSAEIWALVGPPAGSNLVNAHFSAAPMNVALGAISFTGVLQDSPFGAPFGLGAIDAALTVPFSNPTFAAFVDVLSHSTPADWVPATYQTLLWSEGNTYFGGSGSFARITGDPTVDAWSSSNGSSANVVLLGVPFAAAPCL